MAGFNGGAVVFVSLPAARRLFKSRQAGHGDSHRAATIEPIRTRARGDRQPLAAGPDVRSPATRGELAQHSLFGAEQGLSALSAVSIVAGGFVILNSFLMSLGERRRQLAIFRAIGVTSGQVTALLMREAFILGVVGMVAGMALGLVTSMALVRGMEQLLGVSSAQLGDHAATISARGVVRPRHGRLARSRTRPRRAAPPLPDLLGPASSRRRGDTSRMSRIGLVLGAMSVTGITAVYGRLAAHGYRRDDSCPVVGDWCL